MNAFRFVLQTVVFLFFAVYFLALVAGVKVDPIGMTARAIQSAVKAGDTGRPVATPKETPIERMRMVSPINTHDLGSGIPEFAFHPRAVISIRR